MAHTKAGGSTKLGRDSQGQRLGTKASDGQYVPAGSIIVRQRGTQYQPGRGVQVGSDDTIFATVSGNVSYARRKKNTFTGSRKSKTVVSVAAKA